MITPSIYRCTKTVIMNDGTTEAFTEGQLYYGQPSGTPAGEWSMCFTNNQGEAHLVFAAWLREKFSLVEEGSEMVETWEDEPADWEGVT